MTQLIVIGDCCADVYRDQTVLGGTAYNVALEAHKAGAEVGIISAIGEDEIGSLFKQSLHAQQINIDHLLVVSGQKSSYLQVDLDENGSPTYSNWQLNALAALNTTPLNQAYLHSAHVVHAVLYEPLAPLFDQYAAITLPNVLKVGDFSGDSEYCSRADILEKYAPSLDIIVKSVDHTDQTTLEFLKHIASAYHKLVLALMGSSGSQAFVDGQTFYQSTEPLKTTNTTGAGDTYLAHFLNAYYLTRDIQVALAKGTAGAVAKLREQGSV